MRASRRAPRYAPSAAGFTIPEVLIALVLLGVAAAGMAQLFGAATFAASGARAQTSASFLAEEKLEQMRSLTWTFDAAGHGLPVSDTSTDLSADPVTSGGNGLNASPPGTLDRNTAGYVDYLDARGRWVGNGTSAPRGAVYVRRWSIQPLSTNPGNTLILQVLVTTVVHDRQRAPGPYARQPDDAFVTSLRTRLAR